MIRPVFLLNLFTRTQNTTIPVWNGVLARRGSKEVMFVFILIMSDDI